MVGVSPLNGNGRHKVLAFFLLKKVPTTLGNLRNFVILSQYIPVDDGVATVMGFELSY